MQKVVLQFDDEPELKNSLSRISFYSGYQLLTVDGAAVVFKLLKENDETKDNYIELGMLRE